MPEAISHSISVSANPSDATTTTTPKSRQKHRDIGNSRPLSPLGYEANSSRTVPGSSYLDPSHARRARRREKRKRRVPTFKKLLWVRQSFPDNYTDASTFLDHLQRNPRLQPYEFWRLIGDSTIILQQVCSVAIFICCFTGIFQERVSPVTVVGWGSAGTILGWIIWDKWIGREVETAAEARKHQDSTIYGESDSNSDNRDHISRSSSSEEARSSTSSIVDVSYSSFSQRNQQRLSTVKSATLIYCAVLGISPILKSLTKSTTSDSIWAMSCWLMGIHLFFFDYSGGVGAKFPASLSTNAALMASTVLASRLASTTHVFLLTLFSIQVFGLFPVFRRHLRHISLPVHYLLTLALVLGSGGAIAVTVRAGTWQVALLGCCLSLITASVTMGGASWWLIGLQRWKDEIVGPWDAAIPRLRRRWD